MREVVIVSVARTPIGNLSGVLASLTATQLGSHVIKAAVERAGISPDLVQEVIMGNVLTANNGQAPARQAALGAGLSKHVVCTTINKVCASGMKAIMLAAQSIALGDNDIMVAGGMESMTNAPHYLPAMRGGIRYGAGNVIDAIVRDGLQDPYDSSMMGNCGEVCAKERNITREEQDAFSVESYARARAAHANGWFDNEIAPIEIASRNGSTTITRDEEVDNTRLSDMASFTKMRPAFDKSGTITAANASKINDGAAAIVLMSADKAKELGLQPL
ncbi:MAG: acetoacetyl-CoA thiolase, partial [Bacteroidota bacterium]